MINFSGLQNKWKEIQDDLISFYNDVITVHYETKYSGTSTTFDDFFNESLTPTSPKNMTGVTEINKSNVTITGMVVYNGGFTGQEINRTSIGYFENSDAIIVCKIADAIISGNNIFLGSKYITIAGDSERYILDRFTKDGLGRPYVYNVGIRRTNVGD